MYSAAYLATYGDAEHQHIAARISCRLSGLLITSSSVSKTVLKNFNKSSSFCYILCGNDISIGAGHLYLDAKSC